jgi:peptide/nickel transport system ATP-binding protein
MRLRRRPSKLEVPVLSVKRNSTKEGITTDAGSHEKEPVLRVNDLVVSYGKGSLRNAVDHVSLTLEEGKTLAIIGQSGSGKTTLCRAILGLQYVTAGTIQVQSEDITELRGRKLRDFRRNVQAVFQDPFSSLDPRWNALRIVTEPLRVHRICGKAELERRGRELIKQVGLAPEIASRLPHQLSGGQRQRLAIARAISLEPALIVLDEPLSALDVSVQAQVSNLLIDLQTSHNLTFVIVAHDMAAIKRISDDVLVMSHGQAVEWGPAEQVFENPSHDYTRSLIEATPQLPK